MSVMHSSCNMELDCIEVSLFRSSLGARHRVGGRHIVTMPHIWRKSPFQAFEREKRMLFENILCSSFLVELSSYIFGVFFIFIETRT